MEASKNSGYQPRNGKFGRTTRIVKEMKILRCEVRLCAGAHRGLPARRRDGVHDAERLAAPVLPLDGRILALGSAVHPSCGVPAVREDRVALVVHDLELRGLGLRLRGGR